MTLSRALLQLVITNNTQLMGNVATDGAQLIWIKGQCIAAIYQGSAVTTVPSSDMSTRCPGDLLSFIIYD